MDLWVWGWTVRRWGHPPPTSAVSTQQGAWLSWACLPGPGQVLLVLCLLFSPQTPFPGSLGGSVVSSLGRSGPASSAQVSPGPGRWQQVLPGFPFITITWAQVSLSLLGGGRGTETRWGSPWHRPVAPWPRPAPPGASMHPPVRWSPGEGCRMERRRAILPGETQRTGWRPCWLAPAGIWISCLWVKNRTALLESLKALLWKYHLFSCVFATYQLMGPGRMPFKKQHARAYVCMCVVLFLVSHLFFASTPPILKKFVVLLPKHHNFFLILLLVFI